MEFAQTIIKVAIHALAKMATQEQIVKYVRINDLLLVDRSCHNIMSLKDISVVLAYK